MKPLFTIHEGEFLVGDLISRRFASTYEVWVPVKDTGVDLLVTAKSVRRKPVKIQVKFSRGYYPKQLSFDELLAWGWYTLNPTKIRKSAADLWIFAILTLRHEPYFIVVPTGDLKKRVPRGRHKVWHLYLAVLPKEKCYDMRGVPGTERLAVIHDGVQDPRMDYSQYLENWALLDRAGK